MWPSELRADDRFPPLVSFFSGVDLVTSSKSRLVGNRRPGDVEVLRTRRELDVGLAGGRPVVGDAAESHDRLTLAVDDVHRRDLDVE